ncbi:zinc finger bed domain-containing protein daysleeper-like [Hordeum vulgare]|nr:zinc finger bed domain-containing protein daysleeper-like [Hordeum vulgare]
MVSSPTQSDASAATVNGDTPASTVASKCAFRSQQLIAHDIWPIPVTTVASESTVSKSGRILSSHRSRPLPKMVKAIMCMQAWPNADMLGENNSSLFTEFQTCLDDEDEPMDEELSTCNNH